MRYICRMAASFEAECPRRLEAAGYVALAQSRIPSQITIWVDAPTTGSMILDQIPPGGRRATDSMMLPLFDDDLADGGRSFLVDTAQILDLLLHVPKDHALDGNGGCGNGVAPGQAGRRAENQTAEPAPEVASAATLTAASQLLPEARTMPPLMGKEVVQFRQHFRRSPPGEPPLSKIDADGAMLARVIDFHHAVAEGFTSIQSGNEGHLSTLPPPGHVRNGWKADIKAVRPR